MGHFLFSGKKQFCRVLSTGSVSVSVCLSSDKGVSNFEGRRVALGQDVVTPVPFIRATWVSKRKRFLIKCGHVN
jgi:hypothetical protein